MRYAISFGMAVSLGLTAPFGAMPANAAAMAATREAQTVPSAPAIRCAGPACAVLAWPYATRPGPAEGSDGTVSPRRIRVIPIHAAPAVQ